MKDKIKQYFSLLEKWNHHINLIGKSELQYNLDRHVSEAEYLLKICDHKYFYDIGSGGGILGILMAIMGRNMILVEADKRKAVFLKEAVRDLDLNTKVINERIEKVKLNSEYAITAKALGSINKIIELTKLGNNMFLFKGENYAQEIKAAENKYTFNYKLHQQEETIIVNLFDIAYK